MNQSSSSRVHLLLAPTLVTGSPFRSSTQHMIPIKPNADSEQQSAVEKESCPRCCRLFITLGIGGALLIVALVSWRYIMEGYTFNGLSRSNVATADQGNVPPQSTVDIIIDKYEVFRHAFYMVVTRKAKQCFRRSTHDDKYVKYNGQDLFPFHPPSNGETICMYNRVLIDSNPTYLNELSQFNPFVLRAKGKDNQYLPFSKDKLPRDTCLEAVSLRRDQLEKFEKDDPEGFKEFDKFMDDLFVDWVGRKYEYGMPLREPCRMMGDDDWK